MAQQMAITEQGRKAFEKYYADLEAWQEEAGRIALAGGGPGDRAGAVLTGYNG